MKNPDGSIVTNAQAHRERRCLICGEPGAALLRHPDGRLLRACRPCLAGDSNDWHRSANREPIAEEAIPKPAEEPLP